LQQIVPFQFAYIVTELVEAVGFGGKLKGGENGLVDLFGGPAADGGLPCRRTSSKRMMRVSWILIPG
jgi:hypothetical protein